MLSAGVAAGQFKWMVGGDKNVKYKTFKDPAGALRARIPGEGLEAAAERRSSSLAVFARNDGPTLFIDHVKLVDR